MAGDLKRVYKFYGWEDAGKVSPEAEGYERIRDLLGMYDLMTEIWSKETCAPRMRDEGTPENRTLGQCSITAFLIQDIFGGGVYGTELEDGNYHCYNVIDGMTFDLTSEQFGDEVLNYENNPMQLREVHFEKEEKHERYLYIKAELERKLKKLSMLDLIDKAAKGSIDAAAELAEAYLTGKYGDKNPAKAKKWANYAAKRGSKLAEEVLAKL
jgi:TPR repeat protein